jgi:nucleotide-binding universal stress UspA family protein
MKLLIEYDGSGRADNVIEDLLYAGLPREVEAKIISIVEPIPPAGMPEVALNVVYAQLIRDQVQQSRLSVKDACRRLQELFPDWELDGAVYQGKTGPTIIELASEWNPDLVVISPLYSSEFEKLIFGSLSRNIVERASCSVRVVRHPETDVRLCPHLLIGFDGSAGSAAVVREVATRLWPRWTRVRLVAWFKSSFVRRSVTDGADESLLRMRLKVAAGILRAAGLEVSTIIRNGSPIDMILDEAAKYGAQCIYLSGNDRRGFRRLIFGSTAGAVASSAYCTVEVVREKENRRMAIEVSTKKKSRRQPIFEAVTQV